MDSHLNDEAQKIILNTKGIINDLSEELLEFLGYVEDSTDDKVNHVKGNLVKTIHKRVQEVKNDVLMEVEFMTLLERDREKIEEGMEKGMEKGMKKGMEKGMAKGMEKEKLATARRLLSMGLSDEQVSTATELPLKEIQKLRE